MKITHTKIMSEKLAARDFWSLQIMLTCLLPLYLSKTLRSSCHKEVVMMLSAGRISGYIHVVVSMASAVSL